MQTMQCQPKNLKFSKIFFFFYRRVREARRDDMVIGNWSGSPAGFNHLTNSPITN